MSRPYTGRDGGLWGTGMPVPPRLGTPGGYPYPKTPASPLNARGPRCESARRQTRKEAAVKIKVLVGMVFLGICVLALGGFTVRRSRRALQVVLRPGAGLAAQPARASAGHPAVA